MLLFPHPQSPTTEYRALISLITGVAEFCFTTLKLEGSENLEISRWADYSVLSKQPNSSLQLPSPSSFLLSAIPRLSEWYTCATNTLWEGMTHAKHTRSYQWNLFPDCSVQGLGSPLWVQIQRCSLGRHWAPKLLTGQHSGLGRQGDIPRWTFWRWIAHSWMDSFALSPWPWASAQLAILPKPLGREQPCRVLWTTDICASVSFP